MSDRHLALIGFGAIVAIAILRAIALYTPGAPAGIDGGNWLAFGTFERAGMVYPPLVPVLFAVVVGLIGPVMATVVVGAAATAAPGLAVLAALSWAGRPVAGAMAALAIVASRAVGEPAAWGGYPQQFATAFAIVALVSLAGWLLGVARHAWVSFAVSTAAVVATSHLVAVPTVGAIVLLLGGATVLSARGSVRMARGSARRFATAVGLTLLPILVLGPTYATLFSTLGAPAAGQAGDMERVLGFAWPAYLVVLVAVPMGLVVVAIRRFQVKGLGPRDLATIGAVSAAAVSWILAYVVSGEPRLLHDVAVLTFLAVASVGPLALSAMPLELGRRVLAGIAFVAVVILSAAGLAAFPGQVAYYRVLSSDEFMAIEWLAGRAAFEPRAILAADERGVPVGWWVEGMVRQEVLFASDFRWLRFPSELDRARSANALLYQSGFPGAESVATIRDVGVRFVFLPSAAAFGIDPRDPPLGWTTAFASGDAAILSPAAEALPR